MASKAEQRGGERHPIRLSHLSDSGEKRGEAELIMLFCGYAATEWSKINFTRLQNESSSVPVRDRYVSRHIFASLCSVVHSLNPVCNPFAWREESLSKRASLHLLSFFFEQGCLLLRPLCFWAPYLLFEQYYGLGKMWNCALVRGIWENRGAETLTHVLKMGEVMLQK